MLRGISTPISLYCPRAMRSEPSNPHHSSHCSGRPAVQAGLGLESPCGTLSWLDWDGVTLHTSDCDLYHSLPIVAVPYWPPACAPLEVPLGAGRMIRWKNSFRGTMAENSNDRRRDR
jgi:hypothetical protein